MAGNHQDEEAAVNDDKLRKAKILNEAGNDQFKAKNWEEARQLYTEGLESGGTNGAVLYANRCTVYMKQMKYELALQDAMKAVEVEPRWWKGYFRLGEVNYIMQAFQESLAYFKQARDMNPSQKYLTDAVNFVERKIENLEIDKIQKMLETMPEHYPSALNAEESVVHRVEVVQYLIDNYEIETNGNLSEIRKRAKQSQYFQKFLMAEHHFCETMYMLIKLVNLDRLPFLLCEKFVAEYSAGLKMEISHLSLPLDLASRACFILNQILSLGTTFYEDACICYVSLEVHSWESVVEFLGSCIHSYPSNPFFLSKRAKLLNSNLRCNEALQDINAAIGLDPSKHQYWYCRAEIMKELYPQVPVEAAIEAFEEFVRHAPTDDHHVAFAYYHLSALYNKMIVSSMALADIAVYEQYREAAVNNMELFNAAEVNQVPFLYVPARKQFFECFI